MTTYTAEQHEAALARAHAENIQIARSRTDPTHYRATSGTRAGVTYLTIVHDDGSVTCSCAAGQANRPCDHGAGARAAHEAWLVEQHRAALSAAGKLLSLEAQRKRQRAQPVSFAAD